MTDIASRPGRVGAVFPLDPVLQFLLRGLRTLVDDVQEIAGERRKIRVSSSLGHQIWTHILVILRSIFNRVDNLKEDQAYKKIWALPVKIFPLNFCL